MDCMFIFFPISFCLRLVFLLLWFWVRGFSVCLDLVFCLLLFWWGFWFALVLLLRRNFAMSLCLLLAVKCPCSFLVLFWNQVLPFFAQQFSLCFPFLFVFLLLRFLCFLLLCILRQFCLLRSLLLLNAIFWILAHLMCCLLFHSDLAVLGRLSVLLLLKPIFV